MSTSVALLRPRHCARLLDGSRWPVFARLASGREFRMRSAVFGLKFVEDRTESSPAMSDWRFANRQQVGRPTACGPLASGQTTALICRALYGVHPTVQQPTFSRFQRCYCGGRNGGLYANALYNCFGRLFVCPHGTLLRLEYSLPRAMH